MMIAKQSILTVLLPILVLINLSDAGECTHSIYMLPLFSDTTVLSEFDNLEAYFSECQNRAFEEDMDTRINLLSLRNKSFKFECIVGEECSLNFNNPTFNDTKVLREHFMLELNTTYNITDFIKSKTSNDLCLENAVLIIPTNLRCIQAESYPDFWALIGNFDSELNKFISKQQFNTHVLWINYNYLSPTDNVGCELDYLLKRSGTPLYTSTSDKDGQFLIEDSQTKLCYSFKEPRGPVLTKPLLIVVVVICVLVLLLCLACIVLCILKVKYRYKILKLDFLFRRQDKKDEGLPASNYYTMNSGLEADRWEISMDELDIDYDNVLGSGGFGCVVQATLVSQRVNGASRGVNMFNGNLVAVKIMHSTADDLTRANFIREIEIMKAFDPHTHLLNLIGCISDPENPMLISELCEIGDLRHVLVAHKPHDVFEDRPQCEESGVICLRGKDLTSFAWQISDALCYLAANQFVHRDVSARNVFVTRALTAKLGDFGLTHSLDPLSALHTSPQGKVPIKWTSLEALKSGIFSEKSDVWSYGVLLFEMYSGAAMPYPTIESDKLEEALSSGVRPEIPEDVPEIMNLLMTSCWLESPDERPTFEEIRTRLSSLLDVCSQAYGYIQFAQQTTQETPSTPTSNQVPPVTALKEIIEECESDDAGSFEEVEVN
ncbi:Protein tyrosine kinase [Aphelenchoides bicaudatus]|nr:Protein tyrosine kinase [Aphelenchoides bicaudatus]